MPVNAKFIADFTSFTDAVTKADVKLVSFQGSAVKVEQSLTRMVDSFSGRRVIEEATKMVEAIDRVGGVSSLTENELRKVGATVGEAAAKMKALGIEVPPGFDKVAAASEGIGEKTSFSLSKFVEGIPIVEGFVAAMSVERLISFGEGIVDSAAQMVNLSRATGLSIESMQLFGYIGKEFGVDTEQMARGIEQLSRRIASGDPNLKRDIESMGMSLTELQQMSPDQIFLAWAEAVGKVENPTKKIEYASDGLGNKLAMVLLPALNGVSKAYDEARKNSTLMSDQTAEDAHRAEVATSQWWTRVKNTIANAFDDIPRSIAKYAMAQEAYEEGLAKTQIGLKWDIELRKDDSAATEDNITDADRLSNRLDALRRDAMSPLSDAQKKQIVELKQWGESEKDIADLVQSNVIAVRLYIEAHTKEVEAAKRANDEHEKMIAKLRDLEFGLEGTTKGVEEMGKMGVHVMPQMMSLSEQVERLQRAGQFMSAYWLKAGETIGVLPNVTAQATKEIQAAEAETEKWTDVFKKFPDLLTAAFTGGGGLSGALKGFTNEISKSLFGEGGPLFEMTKGLNDFVTKAFSGLGTTISSMLGGIVSSILPGLGGLVSSFGGSIISNAMKIFSGDWGGDGSVQRNLEQLRVQQNQLYTSILITAGAFGATADNILPAVTRAYEAMGLSAEQAAADVARMATVNGFDADSLQRVADAMNNLKAIQDEVDQATTRYGFDTAKTAALIVQNWTGIQDKGYDIALVTRQMSGDIEAYYLAAMKVGATIPESLRPILQEMITLGLLTDSAGNKITDLGAVTVDAMGRVSSSIQDSIRAINALNSATATTTYTTNNTGDFTGYVSNTQPTYTESEAVARLQSVAGYYGGHLTDSQVSAIAAQFSSLTGWTPGHAVNKSALESFLQSLAQKYMSGLPLGFAQGGIVPEYFAGGSNVLRFMPRGTDTIPAMLTPGEAVLNTRATATLGPNAIRALNSGGRSSVADFSAMHAELRSLRDDMARDRATLPKALARATRDALQKVAQR